MRRSFKAVFLVVIRCTAHCHLQCASANLANSASHTSFNRLFFAEFGNKNQTYGGRRVAFRRMNILCEGHHGSGRLEGWIVRFLMQVEQANCASAHDDTLVEFGLWWRIGRRRMQLTWTRWQVKQEERSALRGLSELLLQSVIQITDGSRLRNITCARPSASSVLSRRHVTI